MQYSRVQECMVDHTLLQVAIIKISEDMYSYPTMQPCTQRKACTRFGRASKNCESDKIRPDGINCVTFPTAPKHSTNISNQMVVSVPNQWKQIVLYLHVNNTPFNMI